MPQNLFEKLWSIHEITELSDSESLINIDRIFLHERTGGIALLSLEEKGYTVAEPANVFCTMDHIVSTQPGRDDTTEMPGGEAFIQTTREAAKRAGINLFDLGDAQQGIVHVVSPEQGIALPGSTLVCPDSHTCTLGGLGALAWGIGSTNAEHALATGTLRVQKPKTMRINYRGELAAGVTAKDIILHTIAKFSASGGNGFAVEFAGDAIAELPIEARLTLCNMAVEFSAFTGLVAVDQTTIDYVKGRPFAPSGENWRAAVDHWQNLHSDQGAQFDKQLEIDCSDITPMVTWGTSPEHAISISDKIPAITNASASKESTALAYMQLDAQTPVDEIKIDAAFIGSCTNSRISDLRVIANFLKGKKVAEGVAAVCVPGSSAVKQAAEAEGLDKIIEAAGFEWRESGCSMCFYAGGETFGPGKRVISSTNRNFEGRQGINTKTHLASPLTVAASACAGYITAGQAAS